MAASIDAQLLTRVPLFLGLTEPQRELVTRVGVVADYDPLEVVLDQGQMSQDLWILLSGRCQVLRRFDGRSHAEEPTLLAVLEPYSSFGEMSFFHPAPHSASVRAETAVQLFRLPRLAFDDLVEQQPLIMCHLARNTIGSLADRLRHMDQWVVELTNNRSPKGRPAEWGELRRKVFDSWKL